MSINCISEVASITGLSVLTMPFLPSCIPMIKVPSSVPCHTMHNGHHVMGTKGMEGSLTVKLQEISTLS